MTRHQRFNLQSNRTATKYKGIAWCWEWDMWWLLIGSNLCKHVCTSMFWCVMCHRPWLRVRFWCFVRGNDCKELLNSFNSVGVNGSGGGQKIKAHPPLHKRCKGEGKRYTISWSKIDKLPNRGIEPTTASIGVRFKLGEPVLAIRACTAVLTGYLWI